MSWNVEHFDSISELLNTCDARGINEWASHKRDESDEWAGDGYTAARDMLCRGCNDEVASIRPRKLPTAANIKPRNVNAVVGYSPIVPLAILNVPNCMNARENVNARSKIIHMLYDVGASCNVEKSEMIEQGRKAAAFIMSMERAGYRVQLDALATFAEEDGGEQYAYTLTLKDAARPLDIKRLTYPLLHISMLRQISFDWYERFPQGVRLCGYGTPLYHWTRAHVDAAVKQIARDERALYVNLRTDFDELTEQLTGRRA